VSRLLLPYGPDAVLVQCADLTEVMALSRALRERYGDQLAEIVPAAQTVLVRGDLRPEITRWLRDAAAEPTQGATGAVVDLDVRYDGADLADVAEHTGLSVAEVIATHTGQQWTVAFCGFSPGFGYLVGEDDALQVARRDSPRPRVPAGAVALADRFCGVYPRETPGGWQLIGRTDAVLWRATTGPDGSAGPDADRPALLAPGDRVRFRRVG